MTPQMYLLTHWIGIDPQVGNHYFNHYIIEHHLIAIVY